MYNSNWGSYNTTAHDLYHTATRANANTWRAPTDDSRLLWVYSATTKKLEYYISYEVGVFQRWANVTVPQTAIDAQTVGPGLCFSKPWTGPGGFAFSGTPYQGTLSDWILSPYAFTPVDVQEFSKSTMPSDLSFYDSKITSWLKPGVYPTVTDVKGTLSDGALYNGQPEDFVLV